MTIRGWFHRSAGVGRCGAGVAVSVLHWSQFPGLRLDESDTK